MSTVRKDEPLYAFLPTVDTKPVNTWGHPIETVPQTSPLAGQSLRINNDDRVGENPNRYKQHGFHFTADNCIGCHACEAACSEKNQLPAHISFRSVGYLEGGSYPAYRRLNISMACNHCDNPVCLKGCPTRAYTKFAEYGAVLQDPDICFGCGYCTWVCPYNAPQLDPIKGQVSKCNMCVDRLEAGLKPACAAACLGGALDFGVIESTPENRDQAKVDIPGFPTPQITHPNIRFQQVKSLPREMRRTDSMPLRYERDDQDQSYRASAAMHGRGKQWNLKKLSSRENPLVLFTLVTQAVIGAFGFLFLAPLTGLISDSAGFASMAAVLVPVLVLAQMLALAVSTAHLGKPHRFYRAFNNLRYSPVSREVAAVAVFFNALLLYAVAPLFTGLLGTGVTGALSWLGGATATIAGAAAIYAMHKIYRIKARPYWNHWQVLTAFYGNALSLGALVVAAGTLIAGIDGGESAGLYQSLALLVVTGVVLEGMGTVYHRRDLRRRRGEAHASYQEMKTTFGKTDHLRLGLLAAGGLLAALLVYAPLDYAPGLAHGGAWLWLITMAMLLAAAVIGRALFYVLVIPTTMPGAFFWKNRGFQQHARETGLARMPQVGVLPHDH